MATVATYPRDHYAGGTLPFTAMLSTEQTGSAASTNIADRGGDIDVPALVKITTTVGEEPTCTYALQGSVNGTDWAPVIYADSATPTTLSFATFDITTATTVYKIVQPHQPWRYLRILYSANTEVTNTASVTVF